MIVERVFNTGTGALLHHLFNQFGGVTHTALLLGENRGTLYSWKTREKVPLHRAYKIANILEVPVWGLNYSEFLGMELAEKIPTWKSVVNSYGFSRDQVKDILSYPEPEASSRYVHSI